MSGKLTLSSCRTRVHGPVISVCCADTQELLSYQVKDGLIIFRYKNKIHFIMILNMINEDFYIFVEFLFKKLSFYKSNAKVISLVFWCLC